MPKPIESSFAEKLSLGGSKMGRSKKKKKMKNRYVEPESVFVDDSSDSDEGIIVGSDLKRPGTPTKPNAMIHDDDDDYDGDHQKLVLMYDSFAERSSLSGSKKKKKKKKKKDRRKKDRSDVNRLATSTSQKKPSATILQEEEQEEEEEEEDAKEEEKKKEKEKDKEKEEEEEKEKEKENIQGPMFDDDGSDSDRTIIRGTHSVLELDEAWETGVDHLEDLLYRECEDVRIDGPKYANAAISYMRGKGHNLELVKPGAFESTWEEDEEVDMIHFNFRAKRADDPNAPVETYFGQLNDYWNGDLIVDCCVSVGKSAPPIHRRDTGGCEICYGKLVHHPVGGCEGIHWRHMTWVRWLYANCQVIFKE